MANVCNKCEYTRDEAIRLFLSNNEETLKFLRNHGVLPSEIKCPRCSNRCTLRSDRHCWQCHGKHRKPKNCILQVKFGFGGMINWMIFSQDAEIKIQFFSCKTLYRMHNARYQLKQMRLRKKNWSR
ncbi:uncharacterized protein [Palaemon carinicauda]|uniref:uncharacterized protein isoform X2 n=1 Tax=Palaemon carinicauda TaxID=392227 RepID=UPI0035B5C1B8